MALSCKGLLRNQDGSVFTILPGRQLLHQSLQVTTSLGKKFADWTEKDHEDSYLFMQRIAHMWKNGGITEQYLIYGKVEARAFNWEVVPYQRCRTCIRRIFQQLQVLYRTVFGGMVVTEESRRIQLRRYESLFSGVVPPIAPSEMATPSTDSFCNSEVIQRQWVVKATNVYVLFNYAPIGFGGERLHFLIVTKAHRKTFTEVTQQEYCESLILTKKLVNYITATKKVVKSAYLLNKTGIDAGQTVKHWHIHLIFCTNAAQDIWGKLMVFKNILWGSSPMKEQALLTRVSDLREELQNI